MKMDSNQALVFYRPPGENPVMIMGDVQSIPLDQCLSVSLPSGWACYLLSPYIPHQNPLVVKGIPLTQWPDMDLNNPSAIVPSYYSTTSKAQFLDHLVHIQKGIQKGIFQKSVAFQTRTMPVENLDFKTLIYSLCTDYPHAYISAFISTEMSFISVSPELFIRASGLEAETVALAGTALWENRNDLGEKEHVEQEYIIRHITECLHSLELPYKMSPKQIIRSGHLAHLCNSFTFRLPPSMRMNLIQKLHPTPAVCGYPPEVVLHHMQSLESPRHFYSGFSGVVTPENLSLCVNLRCAEIRGKQALLYAGAGITADSIPEAEWQETNEKLKTLQKYMIP
jgi:isochorismate synthase